MAEQKSIYSLFLLVRLNFVDKLWFDLRCMINPPCILSAISSEGDIFCDLIRLSWKDEALPNSELFVNEWIFLRGELIQISKGWGGDF